jgi:hypothetical protein
MLEISGWMLINGTGGCSCLTVYDADGNVLIAQACSKCIDAAQKALEELMSQGDLEFELSGLVTPRNESDPTRPS